MGHRPPEAHSSIIRRPSSGGSLGRAPDQRGQWYVLLNVIAGAMAIPNDLQEAAMRSMTSVEAVLRSGAANAA